MSALGGGLKNIDWKAQSLEKFEKNFYREHEMVRARSDREIEDFRKMKEMKVSLISRVLLHSLILMVM